MDDPYCGAVLCGLAGYERQIRRIRVESSRKIGQSLAGSCDVLDLDALNYKSNNSASGS
jgi:hypothetical protein